MVNDGVWVQLDVLVSTTSKAQAVNEVSKGVGSLGYIMEEVDGRLLACDPLALRHNRERVQLEFNY